MTTVHPKWNFVRPLEEGELFPVFQSKISYAAAGTSYSIRLVSIFSFDALRQREGEFLLKCHSRFQFTFILCSVLRISLKVQTQHLYLQDVRSSAVCFFTAFPSGKHDNAFVTHAPRVQALRVWHRRESVSSFVMFSKLALNRRTFCKSSHALDI